MGTFSQIYFVINTNSHTWVIASETSQSCLRDTDELESVTLVRLVRSPSARLDCIVKKIDYICVFMNKLD